MQTGTKATKRQPGDLERRTERSPGPRGSGSRDRLTYGLRARWTAVGPRYLDGHDDLARAVAEHGPARGVQKDPSPGLARTASRNRLAASVTSSAVVCQFVTSRTLVGPIR